MEPECCLGRCGQQPLPQCRQVRLDPQPRESLRGGHGQEIPSPTNQPPLDAGGPQADFFAPNARAYGIWKFSKNIELAKDLLRFSSARII